MNTEINTEINTDTSPAAARTAEGRPTSWLGRWASAYVSQYETVLLDSGRVEASSRMRWLNAA